MFSFRTTPLDQQPDIVLSKGRIGVLCNQAAWNPEKGEYLFETLYKKGNLKAVFVPESELDGYSLLPLEGVDFYPYEEIERSLESIDALVVELQELGSRHSQIINILGSLFNNICDRNLSISVYVLDRENPTGRGVEGTLGDLGIPHRHGLTIGEIANMFHTELNAKFPLHVISYIVRSATQYMMPWSIPPVDVFAGLFTSVFYSGQYLWEGTNVTPALGTSRPYEMFGAPFLKSLSDYNTRNGFANWNDPSNPIHDPATFIRWTQFTPQSGKYAGERCYGFQLIPNPGVQYHALAHTVRIMRFIKGECVEFDTENGLESLVDDNLLMEYINGVDIWEDVKEHIKLEEQKWIRKAKKYLLYDDNLWRVKQIFQNNLQSK